MELPAEQPVAPEQNNTLFRPGVGTTQLADSRQIKKVGWFTAIAKQSTTYNSVKGLLITLIGRLGELGLTLNVVDELGCLLGQKGWRRHSRL